MRCAGVHLELWLVLVQVAVVVFECKGDLTHRSKLPHLFYVMCPQPLKLFLSFRPKQCRRHLC